MKESREFLSQSVEFSALGITIQFVALTVKLMEIVARLLLRIVALKPILEWPIMESVAIRVGGF